MDKKKSQDKKILENVKVQPLLSRCRALLIKLDYDFDVKADNQLRALLLKNCENRTSLLQWALQELGLQITSSNEDVLYDSMRILGLLNSKEREFIKSSMNPLHQLQKWELILQCVLVRRCKWVDKSHLEDESYEIKNELDFKDVKVKLLPDNLFKKFQRASVNKNDVTENDIEYCKNELKKESNQNANNYGSSIVYEDQIEECLQCYSQLRTDLDYSIERYTSLLTSLSEIKIPQEECVSVHTDLSILNKETGSILDDIPNCKNFLKAFNDVQSPS